jgi:hypothetical protein
LKNKIIYPFLLVASLLFTGVASIVKYTPITMVQEIKIDDFSGSKSLYISSQTMKGF